MKRNLPPLPWLRAFEASARHLSFTQAASELNLTQAAVSKQIKSLELHLREALFHRKPRSLELTKVGAAYLPKVRDAFERLVDGTEEVFGHRQTESLTVRCAVGFAANWLASRLPAFFTRHPAIPLRIVSSVWNEEFQGEHFDLDVQYGADDWPGFRADRLSWERLMPLCSPALLDGPRRLRSPQDLRHHDLLHVIGYEEGWAVWLRAAGLTDIDPGQGHQFDTSLVAYRVAAAGGGVALGRTSMAGLELDAGSLVAPFDLEVEIEEAFYLVSRLDGAEHPHAEVFRDWLIGEALNARPA